MEDIEINSNEKITAYVCRLFKEFYIKKYNYKKLDLCISNIRKKVSKFYPMINDDIIWNKEFMPLLYEFIAYKKNSSNPNFEFANVLNLTKTSHCEDNKNIKKPNKYRLKSKYMKMRMMNDTISFEKKLNMETKKQKVKNLKMLHQHYEYVNIKKCYVKFKNILKHETVRNLINNDSGFYNKLIKIDYHLSKICKMSVNPYSMVEALMNYMFPDLFEKDNRYTFYRCNESKKYCQLSSKKINLMKILLENRFKINEDTWQELKKFIDEKICGNASSNIILGNYPYLKLKNMSYIINILTENNDDLFLLKSIKSSFSLVDLTEKIIKKNFDYIFKNGMNEKYRFYFDGDHIGLNQIKIMQIYNKIKLFVDHNDDELVFNSFVYSVDMCLSMPRKLLGYNLEYCLNIAAKITNAL
ncbi:hypothetical protein [Moosepox virus GoldyGopher14]|nr:hypothetical protein [Moosepox virus GoldyGopher14]